MCQPNSACANGIKKATKALDQQPSINQLDWAVTEPMLIWVLMVSKDLFRPWNITVWCFAHRLELHIHVG